MVQLEIRRITCFGLGPALTFSILKRIASYNAVLHDELAFASAAQAAIIWFQSFVMSVAIFVIDLDNAFYPVEGFIVLFQVAVSQRML